MTEAWRVLALCAAFPNLPWIADPAGRSPAAVCAMRAVCRACPVREDCAAYVERHCVASGFWAGQERFPGHRGSEEAA